MSIEAGRLRPRVRYAKTEDGVSIAYSVQGEGPALVVVPFFIESFALEHLVPEYQAFMQRLGEGRKLVRFDIRGTGISQRDVGDLSLAGVVRDLDAVVRGAGMARFSLFAGTIGGPAAISYAGTHPDQVSDLILYGTFARLLDALTHEALEGFIHLARADWFHASQMFADMGSRRQSPEAGLQLARWYRESITGDALARLIAANFEADATEFLPLVEGRTLVIHRLGDELFPLAVSQKLAAGIPNARFIALEGTETTFFLGDWLLEAVNAFLCEHPEAATAVERAPRRLSPRENEVLRLVAEGKSSREIGTELALTVRTVERHITNIYRKIDAHNRAQATAYALRYGLIES